MASPIDKLFESIFGYIPTKEGEAYEKLASIACKLLDKNQTVSHDARIRGKFSKSLYQIDVLTTKENEVTFGEAKDYTDRDGKVGRPDLQKLGGALPELPVQGGAFFSATGFTKPAKQYAKEAEEIVGKPIQLFHLRPTTEKDLEGRIKSIRLEMHILIPDGLKAIFIPILTPPGQAIADTMKTTGKWKLGEGVAIDKIYDSTGAVIKTIEQLAAYGFGDADDKRARASFVLQGGHLKISGELLPIYGLEYDMPFIETIQAIVIDAKGEAVLLIKDEGGTVDKVITSVDLKKVTFDDNGEAVFNA